MSDLVADLQDLIESPRIIPPHKRCALFDVLASLTVEQRDSLNVLLEDGCRVSSGSVSDVLRKWGYAVNYGTITRHRRRHRGTGCLCP
jgi:hypothetical protein